MWEHSHDRDDHITSWLQKNLLFLLPVSFCTLLLTWFDETKLDSEIKSWLAFAAQKIMEVNELAKALRGEKNEVDLSSLPSSFGNSPCP